MEGQILFVRTSTDLNEERHPELPQSIPPPFGDRTDGQRLRYHLRSISPHHKGKDAKLGLESKEKKVFR